MSGASASARAKGQEPKSLRHQAFGTPKALSQRALIAPVVPHPPHVPPPLLASGHLLAPSRSPTTLLEVMQRCGFALDDFLVHEVFQDVCWAVAHMHKCNPPLAHR